MNENNQDNVNLNNELNNEQVNEQVNITNDIETVAEQNKVEYKQAPNVDLGNQPIVEETNTNDVTFNDSSQTIGTIKPDKQKSPIAMIILFGLLIAFILFMPEAIRMFNQYFGTDFTVQDGIYIQDDITTNNNDNNSNSSNNNNSNTNTNDSKVSEINNELIINIDTLTISNITKNLNNDSYSISFTIKNNKTTEYVFNKKMYFDFYDSNNVLIDRLLINTNSINGSSSINLTEKISQKIYDNGLKLSVVLRSTDDYPSISLTGNTLTCKNDNQTITYTFKDNKLVNISDIQNFIKTSNLSTYTSLMMEKKNIIDSMDVIDGVSAILTEDDNGFMTSISIYYSNANYSSLTYKDNYYDKNTESNIISFELSAKGYTCN